MSIPPRFPISDDQITQVVHLFYQAVRHDPVLGSIFARHVHDWSTHEATIVRFWRNAILFERDYHGNPMQTHMRIQEINPKHFDIWLRLFDETLETQLPDETAAAWSALAHRIGRGLRYASEPNDGPPVLR
ncbi:group III truncated hemoglobin [Loktanella sp. S4079]|uniref:group III truncated hemoglobin n=1 Tax=Loktanella sp. S4079 TaxID=579483 RepID=UPI0005FA730E|nr:group III truncated hemoglobin [Loktanella sp. S4079]KJZ19817.1 globin family protein [Loktanella sp. S4079]